MSRTDIKARRRALEAASRARASLGRLESSLGQALRDFKHALGELDEVITASERQGEMDAGMLREGQALASFFAEVLDRLAQTIAQETDFSKATDEERAKGIRREAALAAQQSQPQEGAS